MVWLIIILLLVIGFVGGNILLLRHTKKFNLPDNYPSPEERAKQQKDDEDNW